MVTLIHVSNAAAAVTEDKFDLLSLVGHAESVSELDTLEVVHSRFEEQGQSFMAVFEEGQIVGLCSRRRVGMALGSRDGLVKFSQRSIGEFLLPGMTVVRLGQSLPDVLAVVFTRPEEMLLDDVVLMDDYGKFLGLIFARSLVRMQYFLLRQNIQQIEASRHELNAKNAELENDLHMASEIQQALLPGLLASDATNHLRVAHRYLPMGQVSGDFFHRLELAPGVVGLFICDVMGHGVRSAFITAMLRALIQELHHLGLRPGELLARMNEELKAILQQTGSPLYATALYVVVDAATGRGCLASAGHPDLMLLPHGQWVVKHLSPAPKTKGPALGLRTGASYGQTDFSIQPGETLLLFTDGLCEIFNEREEEFGREQLAQSAQKHAAQPLAGILDGMVADALAFAGGKFQDDVCLVGLEIVNPV